MKIKIAPLEKDKFTGSLKMLCAVWEQNNSGENIELRRKLYERHAACRGFRSFAAHHNEDVIGFAYGIYEGADTGRGLMAGFMPKGSHDVIAEMVGNGMLNRDLLTGFDIAELQVLREYRRQGIGEALIRELCSDLSGNAVLLVDDKAGDAKRLYRRLGFVDLNTRLGSTLMYASLPLPRSHMRTT